LTDIVVDVDIKPLDRDNGTAIRITRLPRSANRALYLGVESTSKTFQRPADSLLRSAKLISLNTPLFCATLILKPLSNGSRNIRLNVAR
jgi:hypothetical protein